MEPLMVVAIIIFLISIFLVITGIIDTVIAAFLGVFAMIVFGVMTDLEAFKVVDWNVIFILIGIWIIATYLGKTGLPEYMATNYIGFRCATDKLGQMSYSRRRKEMRK